MPSRYRILDEPTPSGLQHLAVRPFWPVIAQMLAGAWLAWPWLVVNALAIGSPTRKREIAWVAAAAIGSTLLALVVLAMLRTGALAAGAAPYLVIAIVALKLAVASWVQVLQQRTFGLYEHFGHPVRNGVALVLVGAAVRAMVVDDVPLFLLLVLA